MKEFNTNIDSLKDLQKSRKIILDELRTLSKNETIIFHGEKTTVALAIIELQY